jgi:MFS family permease
MTKKRKNDPYAALRIKEFNIFLLVRFALVFAWSMQFIVIEWKVYELTGDPLYLGFIGLMEIIPALSMALFAGHIVDQREKRNLLALCIAAFSLISFGLFWITSDVLSKTFSTQIVLYIIYAFVFFGGFLRAFFGPIIFSLVALIVPKKTYPNAATWNSSLWQMARVLGVSFAGFCINWIGGHWSLSLIFLLVTFSFL